MTDELNTTLAAPVETVAAPVAEAAPAPAQTTLTDADFKIGYVVGLAADGKFIFELLGTDKNVVSLMGIHKYADHEVSKLFETNRFSGNALTLEVGKAVGVLHEKFDSLLKALGFEKNTDAK